VAYVLVLGDSVLKSLGFFPTFVPYLESKTMFRTLLIAAVSLTVSTLAAAGPTMEKDGMLRDGSGKTRMCLPKTRSARATVLAPAVRPGPPFWPSREAQPNGDLTLVVRDDGSKQWALKGQPLYYFVGDATAGDAKGDGMGGTWRVVRTGSVPAPAAATIATPTSYY